MLLWLTCLHSGQCQRAVSGGRAAAVTGIQRGALPAAALTVALSVVDRLTVSRACCDCVSALRLARATQWA